jgi:chaperone modulatory protein CbpM
MILPRTETLQLQHGDTIGIEELALACAMSRVELDELMEYGALSPFTLLDNEPVFALGLMQPLRTAGKLCHDYDLDLFVVVIIMDYLHRIDALQSQVESLQARSGP